MTEALAVRSRRLDRVWSVLSSVMGVRLTEAFPNSTTSASSADLPSRRLRDLGFEADQGGGSIDLAKGQHHRHF